MTTTRRTLPRGKICEEGQGEEEGSASAKEIRRVAVQVDNSGAAFLLMAEATVATVTALLSTVALRALLSLGAGTMTIIPGLLLPQRHPGQLQQQRAGLGVGGDPTKVATSRHPSSTAATLVWAFTTFTCKSKQVELF
jgi:hypothetical protein